VWWASTPAVLYGQTQLTFSRHLYVAEPGIRNYLEYGGHGIIVFDILNDYAFVKRIPFGGLTSDGTPDNVKGICGNASTGRLYVSTINHLICLDLITDEVLWERQYPNGCDRMSMSPDGKTIYQPSFEKENWYILDAATGDVLTELQPNTRAHNTVFAVDGSRVFLAGLGSPLLSIADARGHNIVEMCGPFTHNIRPFIVNVNELLGFEIGDLRTGKKLHRVEVTGFKQGPVKRHGCPSHGIALTPDESEIWVTDGHNEHLHVFDVTQLPPKQVHSIKVREQPGWITFSIDGQTCWSSTGDVIDTKSRHITHQLTDEQGRMVMSEKVLEVQLQDGKPIAVGDQFGRGSIR
jgi:DNA-binding beta-propeller fold protein YncE